MMFNERLEQRKFGFDKGEIMSILRKMGNSFKIERRHVTWRK